ncbi:MAG: hypothetical protein OEM97_00630 [Acidimicrobiia bacterium]|nr:hypothetical protein [Acidimicrobiia bacterium]
MNTFASITRTRRLIWTGIIIGLLPAPAFIAIRIVNSNPRTIGEIVGSVALGAAVALPVVYAWLSLDRRSGLLPVAAAGAVIVGVFSLVTLAPWVLVALIWWGAARRRVPQQQHGLTGALHRAALIVLIVGAFAVLFVHADPVCTQTLRDGTVDTIDAHAQGFASGWSFSVGGSVETSTGASGDVVSSSCASDTIVLGEALASLTISAVAIALAARWPANLRIPPPQAGSDTRMEV